MTDQKSANPHSPNVSIQKLQQSLIFLIKVADCDPSKLTGGGRPFDSDKQAERGSIAFKVVTNNYYLMV